MKVDIDDFNSWLDDTGFLYNRLDLLASKLERYLLSYKLTSSEDMRQVASKFSDVLKKCDLIDYQEDSTAIAYAILHFLNRYRRFQLNFLRLIEKDLLPIRDRTINALDVGTGPGPALYALSDILFCTY